MKLDTDVQILFTTAEGVVTFDDIRRHLEEEIRTGALAYRELFDATAAQTNLTANEARCIVGRLTSMMRTQILGPTAVITGNEVFYGMARMTEFFPNCTTAPKLVYSVASMRVLAGCYAFKDT